MTTNSFRLTNCKKFVFEDFSTCLWTSMSIGIKLYQTENVSFEKKVFVPIINLEYRTK